MTNHLLKTDIKRALLCPDCLCHLFEEHETEKVWAVCANCGKTVHDGRFYHMPFEWILDLAERLKKA